MQQEIDGVAGPTMSDVEAVCAKLLLAHPFDGTSSAARSLTERALSEFAASGLLKFRFLETGKIAQGDMQALGVAVETFAAHSHALTSIFLINAVFGAATLAFFGSAEQKQRLLTLVRAGKCQVAFALTEPEAGSDATSITTSYREHDGGYVLNGTKQFTTGADVADYVLIVARASESRQKERTETLFIVPREAAGVTVQPLPKLAGNVHASCQVTLENVHVSGKDIVGAKEGFQKAWPMLRRMGLIERFTVAAVSVGIASGVLKRSMAYASARKQFGQRICEFQSIQFLLVDMKTVERAMRLLVKEAAAALDSGVDATFEVTSAKAYCAERLQDIVAGGMRIMGGRAYFDFEPMSRYYREAPWVLYAGGTVEIQKRLAAKALGIA